MYRQEVINRYTNLTIQIFQQEGRPPHLNKPRSVGAASLPQGQPPDAFTDPAINKTTNTSSYE